MVARVAVLFAFVSLVSLFPSRSESAEPICAADVQKLCADTPPGSGRIQRCLQEHEAQVSKECRARLDDLVREAGLIGSVCRWDIARLCSDVDPGGARIVSCLEANTEDLQPLCKDELAKAAK